MKKLYLLVSLFVGVLIGNVDASTVIWGAQTTNALANQNGTPATGANAVQATNDLVRLGYFTITDSEISNLFAQGNTGSIQNAFVEYATSRVGNGYTLDGVWGAQSINAATNFYNKPIYYWTFNTPTVSSVPLATQWGIYRLVGQSFPDDTTAPGSITTDLSQAPQNSTGLIVGSFGPPNDPILNAPTYKMAAVPVPEPSTALLLGLGVVAVTARRRRGVK